jgi:hypothetical protein
MSLLGSRTLTGESARTWLPEGFSVRSVAERLLEEVHTGGEPGYASASAREPASRRDGAMSNIELFGLLARAGSRSRSFGRGRCRPGRRRASRCQARRACCRAATRWTRTVSALLAPSGRPRRRYRVLQTTHHVWSVSDRVVVGRRRAGWVGRWLAPSLERRCEGVADAQHEPRPPPPSPSSLFVARLSVVRATAKMA